MVSNNSYWTSSITITIHTAATINGIYGQCHYGYGITMDYLDIAINYRTIIGSSRIYCQIVVNSFYFLLTILNELCLTEPDLTKII